jgi:hypothetical protein
MQRLTIYCLLAIAIIIALVYINYSKCTNCYLIEYEQPPDDTVGILHSDEKNHLIEMQQENLVGGRGGRRGGRWGGRGRGGWSGGWPWRTWPRYSFARPWRTAFWGGYPRYVYTYPLSFYNTQWVAPVQRFTVRIGPKSDRHPFVDKGSGLGYMITSGTPVGTMCGTSGARLDLQRGRTYEFDVYTSKDCVTGIDHDEPFFFTTDPEGGSDAGKIFNINPVRNGTIRLTIDNNTPSQFYYQSTRGKYVGGYVIIS